MDPKLSGLDPKLQDAYQRVMNGPATPPDSVSTQTQTPQQPVQPQTPNGSQPQTIVEPQRESQNQPEPSQNPVLLSQSFNQANDFHPPQPTAPPSPDVNSYSPLPYSGFNTSAPQQSQTPDSTPLVSSPNNVAYNADNNQGTDTPQASTTVTKKKGSVLLPLIVGLVIIFLLGAYTFVWIMIFGVKIPFLA